MEKPEDTSSVKTTSDFIVEMMMDEKDGEEFTREYLKAKFLSSAVRALYNARRKAGLTQAQVAERLNTKQAAIARLEADTEGSMSLRRYVDFALACGMDPLDIILEPVESIRDYVIHNPQAPRAQDLYEKWRKHMSEPTTVSQPAPVLTLSGQAIVVPSPNNVSIYTPESTPTADSAERHIKENREQNTNQESYYSRRQWHSGSTMSTPSTTSDQTTVPAESWV